MKNISNQQSAKPMNANLKSKLFIEGIPYKLLNDVSENSRIYKHLVTIAIMANLMVVSMVITFINRA